MKKIILMVAIGLMLVGCTSKEDANRALRSQGFTDIHITGYDFLSCSKDDFYHTGFTAKNMQGITVRGTVCSGLIFKSATVRF